MQSSLPPDQIPISTMEELEPEEDAAGKQQRSRRAHSVEAALGVLLILGLLGFALLRWWDSQVKQTEYHAGERAWQAEDWEAARAAYLRASGFLDSDLKAAQASRMVTYTLAMRGTVALRASTRRPGLYYNAAGGGEWWRYLPNSDSESRLLARCPSGDLVYDGRWSPPASPSPTPQSGRMPPRRLYVSAPEGDLRETLSINANAFDQFRCTDAGVWATSSTDMQSSLGDSHKAAPALSLEYQRFGSATATGVRLTGPQWVTSSLMPDGRHLLLADMSGVAGTGWHTKLYLVDSEGDESRLLGNLPGAPGPWPYPAAGNGLLFTMYEPTGVNREYTNTVVLLDEGQPRVLADVRVRGDTFEGRFPTRVYSLSVGSRKGQALIIWPEGDHSVIRIANTAGASNPVDIRTPDAPYDLRLLAVDPESGTIFLSNAASDNSGTGPGNLVYINSKNGLHELDVSLMGQGSRITEAWVRGGRLVFTTGLVRNTSGSGGPFSYNFRTIPIDGLYSGSSYLLHTANVPGILPPVGLPWLLGQDFFIYLTTGGEVHAMSYDGSDDLVLDTGVDAFSQLAGDSP